MNKIYMFAMLVTPLMLSNCKEVKRKVAAAKEDVATSGDVTFAKSTFASLARGDSSLAEKIDWPVFTSMDENLGASYIALSSGVEKQKMVTSFITQFATSFRESGGSVDNYRNWRVTAHDSQMTEVAADSSIGVLTITVSMRDQVERVSSIRLMK